MKVLVVDDSEMIRQHVSSALRAAGHSVVEAGDGFDALARIDENHDVGIMILDINMPRMDGLALLERLRDHPPSAPMAIFVLTTEADPALMRQARALGARAWMTKPVKLDLLVSAVNKVALAGANTSVPVSTRPR